MAHVRVAPADHEHLQAVFQGELHKAVVRAQVENVVLVDLRWHHQQGFGVLFFAHGLVLHQLQQLIAKHHGTGGGGNRFADLERVLGDLAGQAVVVHQVIEQMGQATDHAVTAGVEQLLDRQGIEQGVGGRYRVVEQGKDEVRTGAIIVRHAAFIDPAFDLFLPAQVGLETAPVKGVQAPARVGEAIVRRVGVMQGLAQQHSAQLTAQGQRVPGAMHRMAQAVGGNTTQCREQIPAAQTGDRILSIDECSGCGQGARRWFVSHESTLLRQAFNKYITLAVHTLGCELPWGSRLPCRCAPSVKCCHGASGADA
ncbi:hypothetical protein D3C84_525780 [compost metagenome]